MGDRLHITPPPAPPNREVRIGWWGPIETAESKAARRQWERDMDRWSERMKRGGD